ncbi:MAG: hypothetical protein ABIF71_01940 [Planctomycetota bacterium]
MEVQLCGKCGKAVSTLDIEEGGAGAVGGDYFCAVCYGQLSAPPENDGTLEEIEVVDDAPAPVARSSRRTAGSSTGRRGKVGHSSSAALAKVSSSRVRAIQAAGSGRTASPSGRYQGASGRQAVPGKSSSAVIIVMVVAVLVLAAGVVGLFLMRSKQATAAPPAVAQTPPTADPTAAPAAPVAAAGTVPAPAAPDAPAAPAGDMPPPEDPAALMVKAVEDAMDTRDHEAAFTAAQEAAAAFPRNARIADLLNQADNALRKKNEAAFAEAEAFIKENLADDARAVLTRLKATRYPDHAGRAADRLAELDAAFGASANDQHADEAAAQYRTACLVLNDWMERPGDAQRSAAATTELNRLLKDYGDTPLIIKKKKLIEAALVLLRGGTLPPLTPQ